MIHLSGIDAETRIEFDEYVVSASELPSSFRDSNGSEFMPTKATLRIWNDNGQLLPLEWDFEFESKDFMPNVDTLLLFGFTTRQLEKASKSAKSSIHVHLVEKTADFNRIARHILGLQTVELLFAEEELLDLSNFELKD